MKGFSYCGKSTETILNGVSLILCSYNSIDEIEGTSLSEVIGSQTISRPYVNEYGVIPSRNKIEYSLVKSDFSAFTDEEQIVVETWLTSNNLSSDLEIFKYNCEDEHVIYEGKFISTVWHTFASGFSGVTFEFQCSKNYPKKHYSTTTTVNGTKTITINCQDNELNMYVYPKITFKQTVGTSNNSNSLTFSLSSITDGNKTMNIVGRDGLPITIDCKNCRIYDGTTFQIISFNDLGWSDIGNIYWLKLLPGENKLSLTGHGELTIEYDYTVKKVGAWI